MPTSAESDTSLGGREIRRLFLALFAGGLIAALAMALLLAVFANIDAHEPVTTDLDLSHVVGMSVFFCFFTVPAAVILGLPFYWFLRRFGLLNVPVCSVLGAAAGMLIPYVFHLKPALIGMVWFVLSGAAAGATMGMVLRRIQPSAKV